jgi:UDP-N-acetylenolpyruvoylglucosamine reductase
MILSYIITLAISAIQNIGMDSALFLHKFHATIRFIYNNGTLLCRYFNYDIEQSYRRSEFMQKYSGIYRAFLNRRSTTAIFWC